MQSRHLFMLLVTLFLLSALIATLNRPAQPVDAADPPIAALDNVRDHVAAVRSGGPNYAAAGGDLYVGGPGYWEKIPLPKDVIAAAVDVAPAQSGSSMLETLYVGAANELAVYRTSDRGATWQRGRLTHAVVHQDLAGGVTDLAVDPVQQLIYVGTDTAGLFRLRDTGSALISTAQLLLDEPVRQVVTDRGGRSLTLARTQQHLYRATDFGLRWVTVESLQSAPTALTIGGREQPYVLAGTADRGLFFSVDGQTWQPLDQGMRLKNGSQLSIDAVAVDPLQPDVAYAAIREEIDAESIYPMPNRLVYTRDRGATWFDLTSRPPQARVTELLPMSGHMAAAYVLTAQSRAPAAVGNAPNIVQPEIVTPSPARAPLDALNWLAWAAAGGAALALAFAVLTDLYSRRLERFVTGVRTAHLIPEPLRRRRWP